MKLKDIKTLQEVAREYNIPFPTLQTRLKSEKLGLIEGVDYKKLGMRLPTLLSPSGIGKILNKKVEFKMMMNEHILNMISELGDGNKVNMVYSKEENEGLVEKLILTVGKVWLSITKNNSKYGDYWTNAIDIKKLDFNDVDEMSELVGAERIDEFQQLRKYEIIDSKLICNLTMSKYEEQEDDFEEKVEEFKCSYEVANVTKIIWIVEHHLSKMVFE